MIGQRYTYRLEKETCKSYEVPKMPLRKSYGGRTYRCLKKVINKKQEERKKKKSRKFTTEEESY